MESDHERQKFRVMTEAMTQIVQSLTFYPPKAPLSYDSLPGLYVNNLGSILEVKQDRKFTWRGELDAEGSGNWDRLGNDLEGELILTYNSNANVRRIRFVVVDQSSN